jgi:hypothetical protein
MKSRRWQDGEKGLKCPKKKGFAAASFLAGKLLLYNLLCKRSCARSRSVWRDVVTFCRSFQQLIRNNTFLKNI